MNRRDSVFFLLLACAGCTSQSPAAQPLVTVRNPTPAFTDAVLAPPFRHTSGRSEARRFPEIVGSGLALLDVNNDGLCDLFLLNGKPQRSAGPPARLYRNLGEGRFRRLDSAGLESSFMGMGCAAGDYDNDGDTDLYCTAALGPARLYRNDFVPTGKVHFTDVARAVGVTNEGRWGTSAAWLDYDGDGRLDLFVCNYVRYMGPHDEIPCYIGDGIRDYCTPTLYEGESCRLYRGTREGRFLDVTKQAGIFNPGGKSLGVVVWDFNQDGWADLAIANDTEPVFLYVNQKDGTFQERGEELGVALALNGQPRGSMGIDAGAGSGRPRLLLSNFWREGVSLYEQTDPTVWEELAGAGLMQLTERTVGFGARFYDVDNDGSSEMLVINGHIQDRVAEANSGATFAQSPMLLHESARGWAPLPLGDRAAPFVGRALATGDLDNDGRIDAVATEWDGSPRVWLNRTPAGHWFRVRLVGKKSNRDGLGARVEVTAGGRTRWDLCRSGGSYLSASAREVHFGLGGDDRVEQLRVLWPSGRTSTLGPTPADRTVTVSEEAR